MTSVNKPAPPSNSSSVETPPIETSSTKTTGLKTTSVKASPVKPSAAVKKSVRHKKREAALAQLKTSDKDFQSPSSSKSSSEMSEQEFSNILDKSMKSATLKSGEVVEGTILKITGDQAIVDVNYKSEGLIPLSEFQLSAPEKKPAPGQKVDVYIEQLEGRDGIVVLSKNKAEMKKAWQDILKAKENDALIRGKVIAVVKGGLSVDIGIKAFLPGSQMDSRPVRKLDSFVGQTMDFKIIKLNHKRGNIVLSRKAVFEKERVGLPKAEELKEGSIVKGIVKNITNYGAFIDLGDRDGLLHITDMSWSRVEHPSDLLKIGQKLDLKILKFDTEKNRISLGIKQLNEKKWEEAILKYQIGSVVKGKVSSVVDYGAFILLEGGLVEGLVHINEIAWSRKIKNPSQVLKVGDLVDVKVIDIKKASRKLSLSIKQTRANPWMELKKQFSPGDVGEFEVVAVSEFGCFVKVTDEIDGLIRVSDISWTETVKPFDRFKVGDKLKAQVLDINIEGEKFSLGIKQMEENPWSLVEKNYPIGSRHEVEVVRVVDFGAFVKIQNNVEGLIHISELSSKRINKPQDVVKVGDKILAEILSIDKDAKKIGLSTRLLESEHSSKPQQHDSSSAKKEEKPPGLMENFFTKTLKKPATEEAFPIDMEKLSESSEKPSDDSGKPSDDLGKPSDDSGKPSEEKEGDMSPNHKENTDDKES